MNPKNAADTVEFPAPGSVPEAQAPGASARARVDLAALSHPGHVRKNNEDHYLVVRFGRSLQTLLTNLHEGSIPSRVEEVGYGMIVADGIGGAAAGEIASERAITTLFDLVIHTPDWIMRGGEHQVEQVLQRMAERYRRVDAVLSEEGTINPSLAGMGTTMTLACSLGPEMILAHIGDSRAYLLRGGELHQLTRDHTLVQALVEKGHLRREEAATHRLRHVLTRCLGKSGGEVEAECQGVALKDQDQILLCTDGLTDMAEDTAIGDVLRSAASADDACRALVARALERGGKDNVTVIVARYHFVQEP
jgi:protein phosphatase